MTQRKEVLTSEQVLKQMKDILLELKEKSDYLLEDLLDIKEAARYLDIQELDLIKLIDLDKIPCYILLEGKAIFFLKIELEMFKYRGSESKKILKRHPNNVLNEIIEKLNPLYDFIRSSEDRDSLIAQAIRLTLLIQN